MIQLSKPFIPENINFDDVAYAKTILGIEKGRNGKLSKTMAYNKIFPSTLIEFLNEIFEYDSGNKVLIDELNLSMGIEPGCSLLDNCGVVVMRVLGSKNLDSSRKAIFVDGNMYNLSTQMKKWVTDPILISRDNSSYDSFEGFIFGNLCKEDDILIDRKIYFEKTPRRGDLLVFFNTSGYSGSFEETDAILQPKTKNYVFKINESGSGIIQTEGEYLGDTK